MVRSEDAEAIFDTLPWRVMGIVACGLDNIVHTVEEVHKSLVLVQSYNTAESEALRGRDL